MFSYGFELGELWILTHPDLRHTARVKTLMAVLYDQLKQISTSEPAVNERYQIYNFFTKDPEGRTLEFQAFLHPIEPVGFF